MTTEYDLGKMDPNSFEHLVNALAFGELGPGLVSFGKGPDGGRDGYYEGITAYPNELTPWSGVWYLQAKHHAPHLSKDPQKWLLERIAQELTIFSQDRRRWPDNWIVATNIEQSGVPETGSFDAARKMLEQVRPQLLSTFHIWGGAEIVRLLDKHPNIRNRYRHLLTPGHVISELLSAMSDEQASIESITRALIVRPFLESRFTRLEQAGSHEDDKPGLHAVFSDLPFVSHEHAYSSAILEILTTAGSETHTYSTRTSDDERWRHWRRHPRRAANWFIRGGPGQGKSTVGQFFCQIQRAVIILENSIPVVQAYRDLAKDIISKAQMIKALPTVPRIPVWIDLKDYATWYGRQDSARGILSYVAHRLALLSEQVVHVGTLRRAMQIRSWLFCFDGLDEVPQDVKDGIASEVRLLIEDVAVELDADLMSICTSRPQGYSGQFDALEKATCELVQLEPDEAMDCALPVLTWGKLPEDVQSAKAALEEALRSEPVRQIMRTPLQAHIMAVIIRDGGRPPERRWGLFSTFYETIRKREINRHLPERAIADLLSREDVLLRTVHNRMGLLLHARAEQSEGAGTSVNRAEFEAMVARTVGELRDVEPERIANDVSRATRDRLVLLSTPEDGRLIRFDIRQLQEFFAGEQMYYGIRADLLPDRLKRIGGDAHWREVIHFAISALVEQNRVTEVAFITQFLESLDGGTGPSRTFRRRLACGALAAVRLLCEGVLEQDKRLRHAFERSFDALSAWANSSIFDVLEAPAQSRRWILDLMWSRLSESDPSECAGALALLLLGLESEDPRLDQAIDKLVEGPAEFQIAVLSLFDEDPEQRGVGPLLRVILDDGRWRRLTASALREIQNVLSQLSEDESDSELGFFISIIDDRFQFATPEVVVEVADLSLVRYTRGAILNLISQDKKSIDGVGEFSDNLRAIACWCKMPCLQTYQDLRQRIGLHEESFRSLMGDIYESIVPDHNRTLSLGSEDEFRDFVEAWKQEYAYQRIRYNRSHEVLGPKDIADTLRRIAALVESEPMLCQWAVSVNDWMTHPATVILEEFRELSQSLLRHPKVLRNCCSLWGHVLRNTSATEVERAAFLSVVSNEPYFWDLNISSFPLRLPEESAMLAVVCDLLGGSATHRQSIEGARQMVRGFISSDANLENICRETSVTGGLQAQVALLQLVLSGDLDKFMECHRQIVLDAIGQNPRLTRVLVGVLAMLNVLQREEGQAVVTEALEIIRGTDVWYSLETFFERWREVSRAPITTSSSLDEYLAWS